MQNAGTIRWQHITLVHQSGFAPIEPIITVPDLAPGEQAELTVSYPAVCRNDGTDIYSKWKLFYKGRRTSFFLYLAVTAIPVPGDIYNILSIILPIIIILFFSVSHSSS